MSDLTSYPCHGFHPSLPKGKASGSLSVSDSLLNVTIAERNLRIPLDGLELHLGGASDRLVFLNHPSFSDWRIYTSDRSLLKNPLILSHPELAKAAHKARRKHIGAWSLLAAVVLTIVALPVLLLTRMDWVSQHIAKQVPVSWEVNLGETSFKQYKISQTLMDEAEADALLKPLISPLINALPNTPYPFHFYVAENATANAFALPGGYVVIHSGLIQRADSAEELLGVLAHEISHVTLQHGVRNIIGSAGIYVVVSALLGDASGILATVAGAAPFLLNQQYSRKFERQADKSGHALLIKADIDPTGLPSFFQKLFEEEQERLNNIEDEKTRDLVKSTLAFLSTHPTSDERIAYLKALPRPDKTYLKLDTEFEQLKQAVQAFSTRE